MGCGTKNSGDEIAKMEHSLERGEKRVYLIRNIFFCFCVGLLVAYRLLPIYAILFLFLCLVIAFWCWEVRNIRKEIIRYRRFVDTISQSFGRSPSISLPKCRGFLKTMFCSMDVTPFYFGILLVMGLVAISYNGTAKERMLCDGSKNKSISFYRRERVAMNTKMAQSRCESLRAYIGNCWTELKCCSCCPFYCICAKECKCRNKSIEKKDGL